MLLQVIEKDTEQLSAQLLRCWRPRQSVIMK